MIRVAKTFLGTHWVVIAKIAAVLAVLAALWFLIVSPRMEAAELREKALAEKLSEAEFKAEMLEIVLKADRDVAAEHAANVDQADAETKIREVRTHEIRERIVERAAQSGADGYVSDSMDAFLKDVAE